MGHLLPLRFAGVAGAAVVLLSAVSPPPARAYEPFSATAVAGPCVQWKPRELKKLRECVGHEVVAGTLTGRIEYRASGHADLITGDSTGTIVEHFEGRLGDLTGRGELWMAGPFVVDGASGAGTIQLRITRGNGFFAHARGTIDVDVYTPITTGPRTDTYHGVWSPR